MAQFRPKDDRTTDSSSSDDAEYNFGIVGSSKLFTVKKTNAEYRLSGGFITTPNNRNQESSTVDLMRAGEKYLTQHSSSGFPYMQD